MPHSKPTALGRASIHAISEISADILHEALRCADHVDAMTTEGLTRQLGFVSVQCLRLQSAMELWCQWQYPELDFKQRTALLTDARDQAIYELMQRDEQS